MAKQLYNEPSGLTEQEPRSVYLAEGSKIEVFGAKVLNTAASPPPPA